MLCGLLSDTHNNPDTLKRALNRFREQSIDIILHAGDVTNQQTLQLLSGFDVWIAQGNMDRDPSLRSCARTLFGPGRFRSIHKIELDHISFALLHSDLHPEWVSIVQSGLYRYVIYGHTHKPDDTLIGTTRIINPGSLSNSRYKTPTCAYLNTTTNVLTWVKL